MTSPNTPAPAAGGTSIQAVEQLREKIRNAFIAYGYDLTISGGPLSTHLDEAMSALADTLKIVGGEIIVPNKINFASSKWDVGTINRNDPFYHAIHTALSDTSTWSKAGGKLELHHIDNYARKIMEAANQEQRQRLELVVEEMKK